MDNAQKNFNSVAVKALATVGILAILFLGLWGTVQTVRYFPNMWDLLANAAVSITSLFTPSERIEISIDSQNIEVGKPFTMSFERIGGRGEGIFTVSYACTSATSAHSRAVGW